ncbi:unnamed protein product, partial [Allacma fusca]
RPDNKFVRYVFRASNPTDLTLLPCAMCLNVHAVNLNVCMSTFKGKHWKTLDRRQKSSHVYLIQSEIGLSECRRCWKQEQEYQGPRESLHHSLCRKIPESQPKGFSTLPRNSEFGK